ncbi:hypothetical protein M0811_00076 [Anaeramoeba ignava]|uniref:5'-deoxynucleotidase n=1 Tax=Anaeramoeba ignava TaxID=1746090 RepID=A0A9Q0LQL5_ANAIG|nr:hypothetical protein M0811_00076 [Anaeramoeba ignava]
MESFKPISSDNLFEFLNFASKLKELKRTGWIKSGIPNPESVADHSFRVALLVLFFDPKEINQEKAMKMGLIHDLGESIIGDITPFDGVTQMEKKERESKAFEKIKETINNQLGQELFDLWLEFEEGKSPEAQLIQQLDKFEMIKTAFEYEIQSFKNSQKKLDPLESFFETTKGFFTNKLIQKWDQDLRKKREEFWKEKRKDQK